MCIKILNLIILKKWLSCLFAIVFFTAIPTSYAAQESNSMITNTNLPIVKNAFEWQFMVDLSLVSAPVILVDVEQKEAWDYFKLGFLFDISYKGFFLQSNSRRSLSLVGGGELGYQITVQDDWQLDVILKPYIAGFDPTEIINDQ